MIYYVLGAAVVGGLAWLYKIGQSNPGIAQSTISIGPIGPIPLNLVGGVKIPEDDYMFTGPEEDINFWPIVEVNGERFHVAPSYIGPVGIGQARDIAESRGMQLPTPALVDAIWRAADLKVAPIPEAHDGTPKTMASPEAYIKHKRKVLAGIDGRQFQLLGGTHKDVVQSDTDFPGLKRGKIGLYGWHAAAEMIDIKLNTKIGGAATHEAVTKGPGAVIQQPFGGHGLNWIDYSQGVRLVKKITENV